MSTRPGISLSGYTTLGTGGPASEFVEATSRAEVIDAVTEADTRGTDVFVLGGGSNIVVSDRGFDGRVVHMANMGVDVEDRADGLVEVTVEAGESWDRLVAICMEEGLSGFEAMSGIPGSVGGAVVQNIGAYGEEIRAAVVNVDAYDRHGDVTATFDNESCRFEYRNSIFKHDAHRVVLGVKLRLMRSPLSGPVAYAELARKLDVDLGDHAPLREVRDAVLQLRASKGMLVDPADPDSRSAGSFFTNPVIDTAEFEQLCSRTESTPPSWPAGERVKVSAAWLIGRAGFEKGMRSGGAGISSKHTLAIVNASNATTDEVVTLARTIRNGVGEAFGIWLEPEPVFVNLHI